MWVYPPNCRTKVGARWSPSFPRQSLVRRRARNIVQVHAHALNGSWECYNVVRIGLGAIWGDHGRRRSLHFTTRHFCLKKGWVYPLCPFPFLFLVTVVQTVSISNYFARQNLRRTERKYRWTDYIKANIAVVRWGFCADYVVKFASSSLLLLLLLFLTFSVLVANPKKTTLHGGQSRSWSAEQGKENKEKVWQHTPPPTPHTARSEKINKITRRIYRRYAGGRSRVRSRIPSARRLGLWVWLRKILHSRLR